METTTDLYDSLEELSQLGDAHVAEKVQYVIDTYLSYENDDD